MWPFTSSAGDTSRAEAVDVDSVQQIPTPDEKREAFRRMRERQLAHYRERHPPKRAHVRSNKGYDEFVTNQIDLSKLGGLTLFRDMKVIAAYAPGAWQSCQIAAEGAAEQTATDALEELTERLQRLGDAAGVIPGEDRVDGLRRVLDELASALDWAISEVEGNARYRQGEDFASWLYQSKRVLLPFRPIGDPRREIR